MRSKRPTNEELIPILRECRGNMSACARQLKVHRNTVFDWVNSDEELRAVCDEETEVFKDVAEGMLYEKIQAGDTACLIFYLKTRCKDRGFTERFELIALDRRDIVVDLGPPDNIHELETNHTPTLNGNEPTNGLLAQ
jgi:hypothetical protein